MAGAGALASCAPAATPAPGETAAPAPTCPPAAECPPCPVPGVPETWDEEADVVVVGTGIAGYSAAHMAKEAGADVIIIEKEKWYGGNSLLSGGNCQMPANHMNKAAGIEDRVEWAYEDYYEHGEYRNVPELLRLFVENAADVALWLEELGVIWTGPKLQLPDNRVPRTITGTVPETGLRKGGVGLIEPLHKAATDRQIPVKLEHKMTRLIRPDSKGPVLGLEVVSAGKTLNFRARKAVILATGGYKANLQMIRAWHPLLDEEFGWSGGPSIHTVGEGHLAAMALGAGMTDASFTLSFSFTVGNPVHTVWEPQELTQPAISGGLKYDLRKTRESVLPYDNPSEGPNPWAILVENDGKRYCNESTFPSKKEPHYPWVTAYLKLPQRPRKVWVVVDSAGATGTGWELASFESATRPPYLDPDSIAFADTIGELATKMGMPPANLEATVNKYNEYAAAGEDKDFQRPRPLTPITEPPFFGARLFLFTHDQQNGIRVNTKMQVIDQMFALETGTAPSVPVDKEGVIPHLYAAGEVTGGTFGAARGSGKMGSYGVQGYFAGKNAVAETPWE